MNPTNTPIAAPPATPSANMFGTPNANNSGIFTPLPASTPDASTILPTPQVQFKAPSAVTLPSVNFGQFGTDIGSASSAVSKATNDLIASQEAQRQDALKQYNDAVAAFGNPADVYNKLSNSYGIPLYQQQMATLRTLLSHLNGDVLSRVQGTNLTDAQRDHLLSVEQTPLNQQLGDIGNYLSGAQSNITNQLDLYNKAEMLALDPFKTYLSGLDNTFGNQLSAFKGVNDAGITSIQSLIDAKQKADALAEDERTKMASIAASRANNGSNLPNYLGPPSGGSANQPSYQQRKGGGFNFTDSGGMSISAGKYAALTGTPIGTLLYQMAQSGDKYAAAAYSQIKANQAYYNANPNVLKREFSPLFWGT